MFAEVQEAIQGIFLEQVDLDKEAMPKKCNKRK